ncbi:MAG: sensor histidine kinase KdpD [Dehalococcoidia bacterium]
MAGTEPEQRDREPGRPTPEAMLARVKREETRQHGRLRLYLGMAPGVGKTYAMLLEGHRRRDAGDDVVAGFIETHGRATTAAAIGDLEVLPRKLISYQGATLEELDVDAVLTRRPAVALVDELAHTNAPGSRNEKRWQDVHELLDAGITVISTVNIQHLESLADIVESITGAPVRERIPDRVVDEADELDVVDLSPRALRERIEQGVVYPAERAERALRSFFREGNLTALRELALRKVSTEVERDLQAYMLEHAIEEPWPAAERVLAVISDAKGASRVVRRTSRLARALQSEPLVLMVLREGHPVSAELAEARRLATDLGARVVECGRGSFERRLRTVLEEENVGHVFAARSRGGRIRDLLRPPLATQLGRLIGEAELHLVAVPNRHAE